MITKRHLHFIVNFSLILLCLLFATATFWSINNLLAKLYYAKYIVLGFSLLFVICLVTLFLSPAKKKNFIIIFASAVIGLYFAEFTVEKFSPHYVKNAASVADARIQAAKKMGIPFDERSVKELFAELGSKDIWPFFAPVYLLENGITLKKDNEQKLIYPLSTLAHKKTILCNESGTYAIVEADEFGFNNPLGLHDKQNIDIALIGDSLAYGSCVEAKHNVAGLLRQAGFSSVINYGMGSSGPMQELAILKEYVKAKKPKVVFWLFADDDVLDIQREKTFSILNEYVNKPYFQQDLKNWQAQIDKTVQQSIVNEKTQIQSQSPQSALTDIVKLRMLRTKLGINRQKEDDLLAIFEKVMQNANQEVSAWGGQLYFVYLPLWQRYAYHKNDQFNYRKDVLAIINKLNIPVVDMHPIFSQAQDPLDYFPLRVAGHYTQEGYGKVGDELKQVLASTPSVSISLEQRQKILASKAPKKCRCSENS